MPIDTGAAWTTIQLVAAIIALAVFLGGIVGLSYRLADRIVSTYEPPSERERIRLFELTEIYRVEQARKCTRLAGLTEIHHVRAANVVPFLQRRNKE